jgi:hypothetical protein
MLAEAIDQERGENPALDFLYEACALFHTATRFGDGIVKCPFCGENTPELWQHFLAYTDWKGQALGKPVIALSMAPGDERFFQGRGRGQVDGLPE